MENLRDHALIITEYPKSGGTWLTSMIGDALDIPKRDIYVTEEVFRDKNNQYYNKMHKSPWYAGATTINPEPPCVVKSHEFPDSPLISFNAKFIHLIRDGRDVAVSRYFFEKDFCTKNGLTEKFDIPFDKYIANIAAEWNQYVNAWLQLDVPLISYEDLLTNTEQSLANLFSKLNIQCPSHRLKEAVFNNESNRFRAKLDNVYVHNTFVRKCIIGDWKNHFTKEHERIFNYYAGDLLRKLGYIKSTKLYLTIKKCRAILRPVKRNVKELFGRFHPGS